MRIVAAERQIRVGDRGARAAATVAGGSGVGAGAIRTGGDIALRSDRNDTATAGAKGNQIDRGSIDDEVVFTAERALYEIAL